MVKIASAAILLVVSGTTRAFTAPLVRPGAQQQRMSPSSWVASYSQTHNERHGQDFVLRAATEDKIAEEVLKEDEVADLEALEEAVNKEMLIDELMKLLEDEAESTAGGLLDETCEVTMVGLPLDEECVNEGLYQRTKSGLKSVISKTLGMVRSGESDEEMDEEMIFDFGTDATGSVGEQLEQGWEERGSASALRRNAEVWKFALKCVFKTLKPRSMKKKGATDEELKEARSEAAIFIRDGLLRLGPTFVKLGQVVSTRTDVLPVEFTEVLKTLQDEVPGFSGERAKKIVEKELGMEVDKVFQNFSATPLKAASLGQVHTATYKGAKVAIKVQRAGLKELFDVDLKNLKKLAVLLDKFDPKTDGADRNWVSIYEESERLLYLEIDYLHEGDNADRFSKDFKDTSWVRVPKVYREVCTPRVLTMEFVESLKLTDIAQIEKLGLDKELLAKRTAESFLRQIVETGYFHCDPHPGRQILLL
jgi:hypothetical protein